MMHSLETAEHVCYAGMDDKGGRLLVVDNMDQATAQS